mmetsp:Transcript_27147/g.59901  ORF Transcript_27147/g.59901 Transcript_27147/m.59901 type:complete len:312 (-) Transcript_27147:97-1032(-)
MPLYCLDRQLGVCGLPPSLFDIGVSFFSCQQPRFLPVVAPTIATAAFLHVLRGMAVAVSIAVLLSAVRRPRFYSFARHGLDVGGSLHDVPEVYRFALVKGKPARDPLVVHIDRPAGDQDYYHAAEGGLPVEYEPDAERHAPDGVGQPDGKGRKDRVPLVVETVGRRHHRSVGSPQRHSGTQDRQRRGLAHDDHVGAECGHDRDVIQEFQEPCDVDHFLPPCGITWRVEFDEHGDIESCQHRCNCPDRRHIGMVQVEFFFFQGSRLLLQSALQLEFVGRQHLVSFFFFLLVAFRTECCCCLCFFCSIAESML